ncbi:hypothetical protein HK101_007920 [Irineochytrium annulatum]|nr:hypothetical protein HK101_007920 [Irineochytrium annulatum]
MAWWTALNALHIRPDILAFVGLIVIQVAVAVIYKLASASGTYKFSQASSLAISELVKMGIAFGLLCITVKDYHLQAKLKETDGAMGSAGGVTVGKGSVVDLSLAELKIGFTRSNVLQIGSLAALYTINNHLGFSLFLMADPGTIALLKSGCTFISALILTMLGRHQATLQWVSIFLQICGIITSQYFVLLTSVTITALCGCMNDVINKNMKQSLHVINFYLYTFGFVFNMAVYIITAMTDPTTQGFFEGYDTMAKVVVFCNCVIGIAVTAVYKYADAVVKTIAQTCSTSILIVISFLFFGTSINILTVNGIMTIFLATYVYFLAGQQQSAGSTAAGKIPGASISAGGGIINSSIVGSVKKSDDLDGEPLLPGSPRRKKVDH